MTKGERLNELIVELEAAIIAEDYDKRIQLEGKITRLVDELGD